MTEPVNLAPWLRRFLAVHIVTERNLARNTRASYRDTFRLLIPFAAGKARRTADRLALTELSAERVRQFLNHLETGRGCSVQTRNQRLNAIRAFARHVASRSPEHLDWSARLRAIETKKATPQPIGWLARDEMKALLAVPDRRSERGRTEHALLLFLYNSGARVSEAAALQAGDIEFGRSEGRFDIATLRGKGGKVRQCSLWAQTADILAELVQDRNPGDAAFLSRHQRPYTRFGVWRLVQRCAAAVPELEGRKVTPHVVRHSAACGMLASEVDLNTIRAILGHASLDTTNIYAEIDIEAKARAMELCDATEPGTDCPWKRERGVMAFLDGL